MADLLYSPGASTVLAIPGIAKFYLPIVYPAYTPEHFKHTVPNESTIPPAATKTLSMIKRIIDTVTVTATKTSVSTSTKTCFVTAFKTTLATITETFVSTTHRYVTYFSNLRAGDGTPRSTFSAWCDEVTGPCAVRPTSATYTPTFPTLVARKNIMPISDFWKILLPWLLWLLLALAIFFAVEYYRLARAFRLHRLVCANESLMEVVGDQETKLRALEERNANQQTEIAELKDKLRVQADGLQTPLT